MGVAKSHLVIDNANVSTWMETVTKYVAKCRKNVHFSMNNHFASKNRKVLAISHLTSLKHHFLRFEKFETMVHYTKNAALKDYINRVNVLIGGPIERVKVLSKLIIFTYFLIHIKWTDFFGRKSRIEVIMRFKDSHEMGLKRVLGHNHDLKDRLNK